MTLPVDVIFRKSFKTSFILLSLAFAYQPEPVSGHGGGLDKNGCHHDRKAGGYHCHRGPKSDMQYRSNEKKPTPQERELFGRATVTDGDTIRIGKARIRLHGIDAPESQQACSENGQTWRCGDAATAALKSVIGSQSVSCTKRDTDRYGRVVAECRAGAVNLNVWMVRQGFALAYRRFSTEYVRDEDAARTARRGIWRGKFVRPWDWRKGRR